MGNVVYLLGAGASADAIPVVSAMAKAIEEDRDIIQSKCLEFFKEDDNPDYKSYHETISEILNPLITACADFYSIDTYAKKLFLTDKEAFNDFKIDLSFYFTLKQILTKPDKRYDNFWASILSRSSKPPDNVRIISWNYDFQLELSYLNMSDCRSLKSAKSILDVHHPHKFEDKEGFSIMKLNGSATVFDTRIEQSSYFCNAGPAVPLKRSLHELMDAYYFIKNKGGVRADLKFAWETNINSDAVSHFLRPFETLVIIGYSFPFFNREIDKLIFRSGAFRNIYIQDPNPEEIKERLGEITWTEGRNIKLFKHTGQFVFPTEL